MFSLELIGRGVFGRKLDTHHMPHGQENTQYISDRLI